jgi:hypothetical protein
MPAGLGFQAQDGVARVAGANRKGDFRAVVDPDQGSDVLGGIDSHFHVDVKETKAEEGTEVVRSPRRRAVVQVRYCPVPDSMVNGAVRLVSS